MFSSSTISLDDNRLDLKFDIHQRHPGRSRFQLLFFLPVIVPLRPCSQFLYDSRAKPRSRIGQESIDQYPAVIYL